MGEHSLGALFFSGMASGSSDYQIRRLGTEIAEIRKYRSRLPDGSSSGGIGFENLEHLELYVSKRMRRALVSSMTTDIQYRPTRRR